MERNKVQSVQALLGICSFYFILFKTKQTTTKSQQQTKQTRQHKYKKVINFCRHFTCARLLTNFAVAEKDVLRNVEVLYVDYNELDNVDAVFMAMPQLRLVRHYAQLCKQLIFHLHVCALLIRTDGCLRGIILLPVFLTSWGLAHGWRVICSPRLCYDGFTYSSTGLRLSHNKLQTVPDSIGNLSSLQCLVNNSLSLSLSLSFFLPH